MGSKNITCENETFDLEDMVWGHLTELESGDKVVQTYIKGYLGVLKALIDTRPYPIKVEVNILDKIMSLKVKTA